LAIAFYLTQPNVFHKRLIGNSWTIFRTREASG
jgi:hypothetical protein